MQETIREPRLILETGVDARIAAIVEPVIEDLGFELVRVRVTAQNQCTLQIMVEQSDGTMLVGGCEEISRAVSPLLDVEEPIESMYHLEVSSPGIDRPLVRERDFKRWLGYDVKIEMAVAIQGRRKYRGILDEAENGNAFLILADPPADVEPRVELPIGDMSSAKLVMTDELMAQALKAQSANTAGEADDAATNDTDRS